MKLNLNELFDGEVKEIKFNTDLKIEPDEYKRFSVKDFKNCNISGKVYLINDKLFIDLNYEIDAIFECVRCLIDVEENVKSSFSKQLVSPGEYEGEDDNLLIIEGKEVDLKEIIKKDLYLNIPEHILCKEDCKGLCPKCGVNLNEETCECEKENIDPRFEKLKNLFD